MSRSLTTAARERYAPRGLFVLSRSVGSSTAVERFVEAVAGRWERSALELEEQLRSREPTPAWSERAPARPRKRRRMQTARRQEADNTHDVDTPDPEDVAAAAAEPPRRPSALPTRRTSGRAPSLRPRDPAGHRGERPVEERRARRREPVPERSVPSREAIARRRETDADSPAGRSRPALSVACGEAEHGLSGSAAPPFPHSSRRPPDHSCPGGRENPAVSGRAMREPGSSPERRHEGRGANWPTPLPGNRTAGGHTVESADDASRRRFEQWSLERRWREEAIEEWKEREF